MGYRLAIDTSVNLLAEVQPGLTYLSDASQWIGGKPALAIRPLGTGVSAGKSGATPVTAREIDGIVAQGIAVGCYYNGSTLNGGAAPSLSLGQAEAAEAIDQARAVGYPAGCYIWCDLEQAATANANVPALAQWIIGWCGTIRPSVYAGSGGLYGLMGAGTPFADAIVQAMALDSTGNVRRLLLWPSGWTVGSGGCTIGNAPAWTPIIDSRIASMARLWQFSGSDFNDIVDLSLVDESLLQPGMGFATPAAASVASAPVVSAPAASAAPVVDPRTTALREIVATAQAALATS